MIKKFLNVFNDILVILSVLVLLITKTINYALPRLLEVKNNYENIISY